MYPGLLMLASALALYIPVGFVLRINNHSNKKTTTKLQDIRPIYLLRMAT
jgi:hypothetical protein